MTNVFDCAFEYDDADPEGYRGGMVNVGRDAGGVEQAVKLFELPPGQSLCPYHYEYEEEWLLLLEGTLALRAPDGERELVRGELVCFPAGPAGAHKVRSTGEQPARFLMWSSARTPAIAVYPDSDKVLVVPSDDDEHLMFRRADAGVPYYDGEA